MQRLLHLSLSWSLLALFTGCASPNFADAWRKASLASTPDSIEGAWEGTWESLGIMVFKRQLSLDLVADFFSHPILQSWKKLGP